MANAKSRSLGPSLSVAETVAGFCYLPFYAVLLPVILAYGSELLGLGLTDVQLNACYFVINVLVIWLIFHGFLLRSFRAIRFWELVQAVILGLVLHYAGTFAMSLLLSLLQLEVATYNNDAVAALVSQNKTVMLICSVIIAPMVEETLFRGLLFGTIRRKSRIAAYAVTILVFALLHVWQYLLTNDWESVLLSALPYLPAGIALGWTYEKANTVWAPIFVHMLVNAVAFGLLGALGLA